MQIYPLCPKWQEKSINSWRQSENNIKKIIGE